MLEMSRVVGNMTTVPRPLDNISVSNNLTHNAQGYYAEPGETHLVRDAVGTRLCRAFSPRIRYPGLL